MPEQHPVEQRSSGKNAAAPPLPRYGVRVYEEAADPHDIHIGYSEPWDDISALYPIMLLEACYPDAPRDSANRVQR
jgi:hypothetical protein